jgi:hypothetical protein
MIAYIDDVLSECGGRAPGRPKFFLLARRVHLHAHKSPWLMLSLVLNIKIVRSLWEKRGLQLRDSLHEFLLCSLSILPLI